MRKVQEVDGDSKPRGRLRRFTDEAKILRRHRTRLQRQSDALVKAQAKLGTLRSR